MPYVGDRWARARADPCAAASPALAALPRAVPSWRSPALLHCRTVTATTERIRRFAGTPREVGLAAGRAIGPRLEENIARYLRERPQRPGALDLEELRRGALPWLRSLPPRFQEELEGLADGAGVPLQRVVEWNYVECCVDDGCSGFVGKIGGHTWVARNNDTFVPGAWGYVIIREVTGRIPTISFGMEGDVFTPTGVNRERLWLHHQSLDVDDAPRAGRPHLPGWVLLPDLLETCSTIGEVESRLGEVDRDEGGILFAVDGKSDEFAILECACSSHVRRVPDGSWLAGTNHACTLAAGVPDEGSRLRQSRMEFLASRLHGRSSPVGLPDDLVAILADDGVERRRERFATGYANVACPATGELWFTFGGYPAASQGAWGRLAWPW
jgi:hypothetical protein